MWEGDNDEEGRESGWGSRGGGREDMDGGSDEVVRAKQVGQEGF